MAAVSSKRKINSLADLIASDNLLPRVGCFALGSRPNLGSIEGRTLPVEALATGPPAVPWIWRARAIKRKLRASEPRQPSGKFKDASPLRLGGHRSTAGVDCHRCRGSSFFARGPPHHFELVEFTRSIARPLCQWPSALSAGCRELCSCRRGVVRKEKVAPWHATVRAYRQAGMFVNDLRQSDRSAFDRMLDAIFEGRAFAEAVRVGYHDDVHSLCASNSVRK